MSLAYASKGIVNLIAQLSFSNNIIPGFRIRAHGDNPFLQIGLTAADTTSASAFYFGMNTNNNAPPGATFTNSGSLFYSEQVFNANMTISNATTNFTANLGITTDTGASTTIHNANLGGVPDELLITNNKGKSPSGLRCRLWTLRPHPRRNQHQLFPIRHHQRSSLHPEQQARKLQYLLSQLRHRPLPAIRRDLQPAGERADRL